MEDGKWKKYAKATNWLPTNLFMVNFSPSRSVVLYEEAISVGRYYIFNC